MCGIAGEIRFDGQSPNIENIKKITNALEKRGPDADGFFHKDNVAFGHRRLKIMDQSNSSAQPMTDNQLGLTIVFNGAIYNYPELRKLLEEKGYNFKSQIGDTEVILKAYHAYGPDAVKMFNGMFAFVIWDANNGTTFIARDRLGIKPFYYTSNNNFFRFASTLPSLIKAGEIDTGIDPEALNYYMSFHAVVPAPNTILKGVKKLPPATTLTIDKHGEKKFTKYWQLDFNRSSEEANLPKEEWKERIYDALLKSVKYRLVADVPVGVLLSGGLDSSLIVGLLREAGQPTIETFSVGFESTIEEEGNEFKYSDIIAKEFSNKHHKIQAQNDNVIENMRHCIEAMSEPMVSHDAIGFYLLSQEVSKHLKVVQSGQGADEVFAGYYWYPPMLEVSPEDTSINYQNVFFDRDFREYNDAVNSNFIVKDYASNFANEHLAQPGASTAIDKVLRIDSTVMLVDDPVKRVDNMTMSWGLEARVPFLDHNLVELAAKLPARLKVKDNGKYILKEIARKIIPKEVIDRPKGYFPVPTLKYIDGDYLIMVKNILNNDKAKKRGLFRQDYINTLLENPKGHITKLRGSKLWQIALLEFWLQTHIDGTNSTS